MKQKDNLERELPKIAFFGTPEIAVLVLEELHKEGFTPSLIVTNPDRKQGRGLAVSAPPVKEWALQHDIEVFQPTSVSDKESLAPLLKQDWDIFIVVAYGAIMPLWLIEIPKHGTVNVHPSLLPKLRGASPIRTSILNDLDGAGVSIMHMDEKMDHGPLLAQETYTGPLLPGGELDVILAKKGGVLLASILPELLAGSLVARDQDHSKATYSKKISKEMAQLAIDPHNLPTGATARATLLKIYAYDQWPTAFFIHNDQRVKITRAHIENDALVIDTVIPEGKKEMSYEVYLQSLR